VRHQAAIDQRSRRLVDIGAAGVNQCIQAFPKCLLPCFRSWCRCWCRSRRRRQPVTATTTIEPPEVGVAFGADWGLSPLETGLSPLQGRIFASQVGRRSRRQRGAAAAVPVSLWQPPCDAQPLRRCETAPQQRTATSYRVARQPPGRSDDPAALGQLVSKVLESDAGEYLLHARALYDHPVMTGHKHIREHWRAASCTSAAGRDCIALHCSRLLHAVLSHAVHRISCKACAGQPFVQ